MDKQTAPAIRHRKPVDIADEGFSILSDPSSPVADIVFIHGLQGHPKRTWLYGREDPRKPLLPIPRLFNTGGFNSSKPSDSCYWPEDLLAQDFKNCRIATYGYDSRVCNFFGGAANQTNIIGHGTSLLNALEALRGEDPKRSLIFVVHGVGGLILKEALRQSWHAQPYEQDLKDIYDATRLTIFMGTPHRGSYYASWGLLFRNIAVVAGFDASDRILRDLKPDSSVLEILRTDFAKMLREERFAVWTFVEGRGLTGVRGLTRKVVDDVSSRLYDARERHDTINASHAAMCRFSGPQDPGYRKVKSALAKCVEKPASRAADQSRLSVVVNSSNLDLSYTPSSVMSMATGIEDPTLSLRIYEQTLLTVRDGRAGLLAMAKVGMRLILDQRKDSAREANLERFKRRRANSSLMCI